MERRLATTYGGGLLKRPTPARSEMAVFHESLLSATGVYTNRETHVSSCRQFEMPYVITNFLAFLGVSPIALRYTGRAETFDQNPAPRASMS